MSIRIAIAKMLAPELAIESDRIELMSVRHDVLRDEYEKTWERRRQLTSALIHIAGQRTPKANATVRRICDMAEAALKGSE